MGSLLRTHPTSEADGKEGAPTIPTGFEEEAAGEGGAPPVRTVGCFAARPVATQPVVSRLRP